MSLANLGDLQTALADWLYRSGDAALAARADDFITLFEADFTIDPDMRTLEMEETDTATVSTASLTLPDGYLDMVSIQVLGASINAQNVGLDYVTPRERVKLDATTATSGICKNYTILSGQIMLTPAQFAPVGATVELVYNKFVPLKSSGGGVNWLLNKYPNLYLYGSLMQASAFIDDKQTVAQWKAGRDEAMGKLSKASLKRKLGGSPMRMRPSAGFIN